MKGRRTEVNWAFLLANVIWAMVGSAMSSSALQNAGHPRDAAEKQPSKGERPRHPARCHDQSRVPGASDWRTGAVAFGVMSLYALVIVVASFYIKKHIGQKTWRLIHFSSLGVFLASLIHGVSAGTDTRTPVMIGLYMGSAGVVALLLLARLTGAVRPCDLLGPEVRARRRQSRVVTPRRENPPVRH